MDIFFGLFGTILGALVITYLVTRAVIRHSGSTRKGAIRAFLIGLVITWGLRIAVWHVLDSGYGDISASLVAYTISLLIWLYRDYRNAEPDPFQTDSNTTSVFQTRIARLDHPLKRLSFLISLCSAVALAGLALLPRPFEISSYPEWRDSTASDTPDRSVLRVNTACAGKLLGSTEDFARDFFIVDAFSSENKYSRVITEIAFERGERSVIAPTVDLTETEKTKFVSMLSSAKRPCLKGTCLTKLDTHIFASILNACSTSVGQVRKDVYMVQWHILSNLENTFPWSLFALLLSMFFLLPSLLYDRTLGPLINWVRTGSW